MATTGPEVATTRPGSGDEQGFFQLVPRFSSPKWRRPVFSRIYWDKAFLGALGFGEASGRLRGGFRKASGRLRLPTRIFRLFHRSATNVKHISVFSRIFWDRSLFRCLRLWGGFGEDLGRLLLYGPAPFGRLGQVTDS